MQQKKGSIMPVSLPFKTTVTMLLILSAISIGMFSFKKETSIADKDSVVNEDSVASVQAFKEVYKVLMSPRCMNCHPAGDIPLQGEDSHLHTMGVKRGADGKGVYAVKCSNCHQS